MSRARSIDVLVRFARVVSDAAGDSEVLPVLADTLKDDVPASGVCVVQVGHHGHASVAVTRGIATDLAMLELDSDAIGSELGDRILAAAGDGFVSEQTRPLVAGGNLFGAVVLLFKADDAPSASGLRLAEGLVDLAAIALGNAAQLAQLERSMFELRASQELLARSEKLRALGQMAAGVSHDLKNILNPLSLHLQLIERALVRGQTEDAKESCAEMRQVLLRGVQTLDRLRDYSRQSKETKTELVDLDALATEAVEIARPRAVSPAGATKAISVRIQTDLHAPAPVMAITGEVVSALVNLLVNAIDALAGHTGGTITLTTGEADAGAWVRVSDDGPGMPADVEKRVFEPFFTTKGADGTGLGLAMVYACMQRHGGTVHLDTAPGRGTSFTLWFPGSPTSQSG